jgi:hypothetical protein
LIIHIETSHESVYIFELLYSWQGQEESLNPDPHQIRPRKIFKYLLTISLAKAEYVRPGAQLLGKDDWEVDINRMAYRDYKDCLGHLMIEGNTSTIGSSPFLYDKTGMICIFRTRFL